jgi:arabinose-5-phosphate isomerase
MITRNDVLLALSNSGETAEVLLLIPHLSRLGVPIIAVTGNPKSALARAASVHLDVSVDEEACPLNLAPTASTTATLALGDALAVSLLEARGFTPQDFARSHPAARSAASCCCTSPTSMRSGDDLPIVSPATLLGRGTGGHVEKRPRHVHGRRRRQTSRRLHRRRPATRARPPRQRSR